MLIGPKRHRESNPTVYRFSVAPLGKHGTVAALSAPGVLGPFDSEAEPPAATGAGARLPDGGHAAPGTPPRLTRPAEYEFDEALARNTYDRTGRISMPFTGEISGSMTTAKLSPRRNPSPRPVARSSMKA